MNKQILYRSLKDLLGNQPDWHSIDSYLEWVGKAYALVKRWNTLKAELLQGNVAFINTSTMRSSSITGILNIVNQAIQDIEIDLPDEPKQIFGPGAVYDFYKELNDLLKSAKRSIMIIDPYLDSEIFDGYVGRIEENIEIKIFTGNNAKGVKIAFEKYVSQNKKNIEIKVSQNLHDRVIIIDDQNCWVLGQSIKDAAVKKQTYMVPITDENSRLKITHYKNLFNESYAI